MTLLLANDSRLVPPAVINSKGVHLRYRLFLKTSSPSFLFSFLVLSTRTLSFFFLLCSPLSLAPRFASIFLSGTPSFSLLPFPVFFGPFQLFTQGARTRCPPLFFIFVGCRFLFVFVQADSLAVKESFPVPSFFQRNSGFLFVRMVVTVIPSTTFSPCLTVQWMSPPMFLPPWVLWSFARFGPFRKLLRTPSSSAAAFKLSIPLFLYVYSVFIFVLKFGLSFAFMFCRSAFSDSF